MLVRLADRLQGQKQDGQVGRNAFDRAGEVALVDERVDADRQWGPCCSIAATGSTATTLLMSVAAKSHQPMAIAALAPALPVPAPRSP
jgi:hypothetical protein